MTALSTLLQDYAESHQHPTNQWIHKFCVPLIEWSLLGMLSALPHVLGLDGADLVAAVGLGYYAQFRNRKVLFASIVMLVPFWAFRLLHLPSMGAISLGVFVLAWIGQFIGHKIEGRKPSFVQDLQFLLIGPLWVAESLLRRFGLSLL